MHGWRLTVVALMMAPVASSAAVAEGIPRAEHPRPQMRRDAWLNLNGPWQFRFDADDRGLAESWFAPTTDYQRQIIVPFGWQSPLSGIADRGGQTIGWYRRTAVVPQEWSGRQIWLHFDAVNSEAQVWVNGKEAAKHEGGYTPFAVNITSLAAPGERLTIVVRAKDAANPEQPLDKHVGAWHAPTSGIWQTVWLEARPARHLAAVRMTPKNDRNLWKLDIELEASGPDGRAVVEVTSPDDSFPAQQGTIELRDGTGRGWLIIDFPAPEPWSPEDPHLYDLDIHLAGDEPKPEADLVHTYFGLRTIVVRRPTRQMHQVILLNGNPIYLRGALDRSFNPQGISTAPSDEFMQRDIALAKQLGLNFLRIHSKSEEPRRLHWADRLGMLIMEDIPSTGTTTPRGRDIWDATMRATIRRDINHPSIIAWRLFNERWTLGGPEFKQDEALQQWVLQTWTDVKERLDPSRPLEDNSPCQCDHIKTDINSWHVHIDDYERARRQIADMVRHAQTDSESNSASGRTQTNKPLLVSEYGALGARGGDRDVSFAFRYLTTLLRQHELIGGYVYTELTDVEGDHNGFLNYDRTPKEFGYDGFVPGMTTADLQGAVFVGCDAPPILEVAPGDQFSLAVFVSHYAERRDPLMLRWQIVGTDDLGQSVATEPRETVAAWQPHGVTFQKPLSVKTPDGRPFVGAIAIELIDTERERVAANYVNLVVRQSPLGIPKARAAPAPQSPRVEVLGPRLVAARFSPDEFATRSDAAADEEIAYRGKFCAPGDCEVRYDLTLPEFVRNAIPTQIVFMAELATRAENERLDWPAARRPSDRPQTDAKKHVGAVHVRLLGRTLWQFELPDDPADSRGVLSHQQQHECGGFGFLLQRKVNLTQDVELRGELRSATVVPLIFRAAPLADGGRAAGLSIYGERLGRYPIDPTLLIHTARDLVVPRDKRALARESIAVHRWLDQSHGDPAAPQGDTPAP